MKPPLNCAYTPTNARIDEWFGLEAPSRCGPAESSQHARIATRRRDQA